MAVVSMKAVSFLLATAISVFCLQRLQRSDAFSTATIIRRSGMPPVEKGLHTQTSTRQFRFFSYLDSLSGKTNDQNEDISAQQTKMDSNGHFAASASWGGSGNGGEEYQDQYGRTIASPLSPTKSVSSSPWSPQRTASDQLAEDIPSKGFALQFDPMSAVANASAQEVVASSSSKDHESPHEKHGHSAQPGSRISSIQSLQDVAVTNNPYSTVGKDSPQEGRRLQQPKTDAQSTNYRRSPNFDFAKESDKYLKFSSQRIGHDRLEPMSRPTQTQYSSNRPRSTESVMEERKPNTMFHSNNQAAILNARAVAKKPNIDLDHLNDVISNPSPFRFLGQVDPNVDAMKPSIQAMRDRDVGTEERERSFFGSRAQYRQVRPDAGL